ncbi:NADH dehydrogenase [ubiquinone] iron-sulfur protein 5-like [Diadema setosum]|uniref:NADH dehydrogenase [ubiquinone] iron-sulfur protein 5-like n=1 Tax=Diadema antillarum TaxID=105358 RepID=UPI003A8A2287
MPLFRIYEFDKYYTTHQGVDYGGLPDPKCKNYEADFLRCAAKIGALRAEKECSIEIEDFRECVTGSKRLDRIRTIMKRRDQLVKEGKYTPPPKQN